MSEHCPGKAPKERADTKRPLNRRQAARELTQRLVLDGARELFRKDGYEATTMRTIASSIGRSTGAIFAHYDTKDELYVAALGHAPLSPERGLQLVDVLRRAQGLLMAFEEEEGVAALLAEIDAVLPPLPIEPVADGDAEAEKTTP